MATSTTVSAETALAGAALTGRQVRVESPWRIGTRRFTIGVS